MELASFGEAVVSFTNEFLDEASQKADKPERFLLSTKLMALVLPLEGEFIVGAAFDRCVSLLNSVC